MVSVAWDVFAVSETQRHWSNALASTRMVILWLPSRHSAYDGFLSAEGTIANFMMRRLAGPPGPPSGSGLLALVPRLLSSGPQR